MGYMNHRKHTPPPTHTPTPTHPKVASSVGTNKIGRKRIQILYFPFMVQWWAGFISFLPSRIRHRRSLLDPEWSATSGIALALFSFGCYNVIIWWKTILTRKFTKWTYVCQQLRIGDVIAQSRCLIRILSGRLCYCLMLPHEVNMHIFCCSCIQIFSDKSKINILYSC